MARWYFHYISSEAAGGRSGIGARRPLCPFARLTVTSATGVECRSATGNLRAVQILLGHTKIENTVRYLGVDVEDALTLAEGIEV